MRKFVIRFSWVRNKIENYPSRMGIGTKIEREKSSRRFSIPPEKAVEEKAQKIWNAICGNYKYNKYEEPTFIALEEIQTIEAEVVWQPSP